MKSINYQPIGVIHTSHNQGEGTPIQPRGAEGVEGKVEVYERYQEGLKDLEGFSHIILLYHFHQSRKESLKQQPYMDDQKHGVFAMRGPSRPNPLGLSIVKLNKVEDNVLYVENVDMLNGTPLLDIKPYVPEFDRYPAERIGWLEDKVERLEGTRDDGRFHESDQQQ